MKNIFKKKKQIKFIDTSIFRKDKSSLIVIKHIRQLCFNEIELYVQIDLGSNIAQRLEAEDIETFNYLKKDLTKLLKNYYGEE